MTDACSGAPRLLGEMIPGAQQRIRLRSKPKSILNYRKNFQLGWKGGIIVPGKATYLMSYKMRECSGDILYTFILFDSLQRHEFHDKGRAAGGANNLKRNFYVSSLKYLFCGSETALLFAVSHQKSPLAWR